MNVSSEKSTSLWMGTKVLDDAPALYRGEIADVVVVGSGMAGMSVAYQLAKAGKDVVVIDRGTGRQGHDLAHDRTPDGAMRRRLPPADPPPRRGDGQALVTKPGRVHRLHRSQRGGSRYRL
jgi:flavin-dependent dehydrogenase